jgi:hypothetical protein
MNITPNDWVVTNSEAEGVLEGTSMAHLGNMPAFGKKN